jgi:hypothetical protein
MVNKVMLYRTKGVSKIKKRDVDSISLLPCIGQQFIHYESVLSTTVYAFDKSFLCIRVQKIISQHIF